MVDSALPLHDLLLPHSQCNSLPIASFLHAPLSSTSCVVTTVAEVDAMQYLVQNMQADTFLGQSKAGLLNRVRALEDVIMPANGTEVMKVDAS